MPLPKIRLLLSALLAGAVFCALTPAQQPPTYKVDVNVVNVLATVHDRNGRLINDLSKDDFILEEDGIQQEIRYFTRQTEMPLKIGLLIDTSMSQRSLIEDERSASYQFLDQVLRPDKDQAFVIRFDTEAELLEDLTNSRSLLKDALDALKASWATPRRPNRWDFSSSPGLPFAQRPGGQRRPGGGRQGGPGPGGPGRMPGIGTLLFDSVFLASDEILKQQEGRKAIILISDGVDNGSKVSENEATEAAHHADTIIYSIRYYDPAAYSVFGRIGNRNEGSRGTTVLTALSKQTGGRMFEVSRKMSLKDIYDRIQEELRNQYNLGYTPSSTRGTAFRHIKLRTKDSKYEVVTRAGYYPKHS
jgi:VWFA-related protein